MCVFIIRLICATETANVAGTIREIIFLSLESKIINLFLDLNIFFTLIKNPIFDKAYNWKIN